MFEELAGYGTLTVKRAYGDWTNQQLNGWKDQLHANAISPMQQFAYTGGQELHRLRADHRRDGPALRRQRRRVRDRLQRQRLHPAGDPAARVRDDRLRPRRRQDPQAFRDACDKFTFLEVLRADAATAGPRPRPRAEAPSRRRDSQATLQSMLTKALNKTAPTTTTGRPWAPSATT